MIAPFALTFLFNVSLFLIVMASLIRRFYRNIKMNYSERNRMKEVRNLIVIGTSLSVLFGLGWVFGLLAQIPQPILSSIAQYIFSVCVGFQGTLIFVLHGLRSADVRRVWKQWFYKIMCCIPTPPGLLSNYTSSQLPSPVRKTAPTTLSDSQHYSDSRHSENPLYQSTETLDTPYPPDSATLDTPYPLDSATLDTPYPPDTATLDTPYPPDSATLDTPYATHDKMALLQDQDEESEWQSLEVNFSGEGDSSSDDEPNLRDLQQVPFSEGQLGTAIAGVDHETTQL